MAHSQIETNVRPFIKWAGSKRQLIPTLLEYVPNQFNKYMEPFAGSGQLFFSLTASLKKSVLSDTNIHLIQTYQALQKNPTKVAKYLQSFPATKEFYLLQRPLMGSYSSIYKNAAIFIFLNRYSFNGLYRTNARGKFNVPFNDKKNGNLPDIAHLKRCSLALHNTQILCNDFDTVVRYKIEKGDFIYLDPPYAQANDRLHKQYGPHTFGHFDIARLQKLLKFIDRTGSYFMLSYASCYEASVFSGWNAHHVEVRRNIAGFSGARKKAKEIIFTNY